MKNIILHILCEGPTEEGFVKKVLSPFLREYNIFSKPTVLVTSRKKNAKGGMISYIKAKNDLIILRKQYKDNDNNKHYFTTMFDYYALPNDFPAFEESYHISDVRKRIEVLEKALAEDLKISPFIPYLQLHEFEALLFVDIEKLINEYPLSEKQIKLLKKETVKYGDPEMINNSPETAPSKRIIRAVNPNYNYNKVKSGTSVSSLIGMEQLLDNCQHFKEWIDSIIKLAHQ